jgi:hypothetical protein
MFGPLRWGPDRFSKLQGASSCTLMQGQQLQQFNDLDRCGGRFLLPLTGQFATGFPAMMDRSHRAVFLGESVAGFIATGFGWRTSPAEALLQSWSGHRLSQVLTLGANQTNSGCPHLSSCARRSIVICGRNERRPRAWRDLFRHPGQPLPEPAFARAWTTVLSEAMRSGLATTPTHPSNSRALSQVSCLSKQM